MQSRTAPKSSHTYARNTAWEGDAPQSRAVRKHTVLQGGIATTKGHGLQRFTALECAGTYCLKRLGQRDLGQARIFERASADLNGSVGQTYRIQGSACDKCLVTDHLKAVRQIYGGQRVTPTKHFRAHFLKSFGKRDSYQGIATHKAIQARFFQGAGQADVCQCRLPVKGGGTETDNALSYRSRADLGKVLGIIPWNQQMPAIILHLTHTDNLQCILTQGPERIDGSQHGSVLIDRNIVYDLGSKLGAAIGTDVRSGPGVSFCKRGVSASLCQALCANVAFLAHFGTGARKGLCQLILMLGSADR